MEATHAVTLLEADDMVGGIPRIEGDHFINTMPIRSLVRAPMAPVPIRGAAEGLKYRNCGLCATGPSKTPNNPGLSPARREGFRRDSRGRLRASTKLFNVLETTLAS